MQEETGLAGGLAKLLVGQPAAIQRLLPFVELYQSGLVPDGRPAGVAMLLGPSGAGKTHTVEAMAQVLHGNRRNLLQIDCGEYQLDQEIARLIGAPPGYLGHRETQPLLSQHRINGVRSDGCDLSLVLFDEIEKASGALARLLFGVLDKATLRLGDNTTVDFSRCLIFLTSNLGSERIAQSAWGLGACVGAPAGPRVLEQVALQELRRKFDKAFIGRLDAVITYRSLTRADYGQILTGILESAGQLVNSRLGNRAFRLGLTPASRDLLLDLGVSAKFGARELKHTFERNFIHPLASMVTKGLIVPESLMVLDARGGQFSIEARAGRARAGK